MSEPTYAYEGVRRLVYGEDEGATFVPICEKCGRFVQADKEVLINDRNAINATCSKCGRTRMLFEGYI